MKPAAAEPNPHGDACIVLVCNGPGELATWVRPLAQRLHRELPLRPLTPGAPMALQLVLVPCPNATGIEHQVADRMGLFERISPAKRFWSLLLRPQRLGRWPRRGVVVFLGGDQFWTVLLSARLGYRHITYAEWVARWPRWNDRIAAMGPAAADRLARRWQPRCQVVGDLMADLSEAARSERPLPQGEWVALMPGSKRAKLQVGVPFLLEAADRLAAQRPGIRFLLPVAPTTSVQELLAYGSAANPIAQHYGSGEPVLEGSDLVTPAGSRICLVEEQPAHGVLSQCQLALTTVGVGCPGGADDRAGADPALACDAGLGWGHWNPGPPALLALAAGGGLDGLADAQPRLLGLAQYLRRPPGGARAGRGDHTPGDRR